MNIPIVSVSHVVKTYTDDGGRSSVTALADISLEIMPGEFFVLLGPSGCGKSTLLRIMSGLDRASKGDVKRAEGSEVGFVFQQFALLPWLTVWENIEMPLLSRPMAPATRANAIRPILKQLGLEKFEHHRPRDLSGGMRQRVGIARALVTNPGVIFLDEPFSELDSFTAETLRMELLDIWHERKMTIIMVSHIISEALELADRIAVMSSRPGTISTIVRNTLPRPRAKRSVDFYALEDHLAREIKLHS